MPVIPSQIKAGSIFPGVGGTLFPHLLRPHLHGMSKVCNKEAKIQLKYEGRQGGKQNGQSQDNEM